MQAVVEVRTDPGGLTNVGRALHSHDSILRIGTMVAANSGRPAGACGTFDAARQCGAAVKLHPGHKTQEEDVVSNWLLTDAYNQSVRPERQEMHCSQVFRRRLYRRWGLSEPNGSANATLQNVDYTAVTRPEQYSDAWVLDDVYLSSKVVRSASNEFDFSCQYPTTLYFAAGPNAGARGRSSSSSTRRTFNDAFAADYDLFRSGVKAALRAALVAMALRGCDVALLAGVSTGLYAGDHQPRLLAEFEAIVNEVLSEPIPRNAQGGAGPASLGECFVHVIWTRLA